MHQERDFLFIFLKLMFIHDLTVTYKKLLRWAGNILTWTGTTKISFTSSYKPEHKTIKDFILQLLDDSAAMQISVCMVSELSFNLIICSIMHWLKPVTKRISVVLASQKQLLLLQKVVRGNQKFIVLFNMSLRKSLIPNKKAFRIKNNTHYLIKINSSFRNNADTCHSRIMSMIMMMALMMFC